MSYSTVTKYWVVPLAVFVPVGLITQRLPEQYQNWLWVLEQCPALIGFLRKCPSK